MVPIILIATLAKQLNLVSHPAIPSSGKMSPFYAADVLIHHVLWNKEKIELHYCY
jgi:hypothetical protein